MNARFWVYVNDGWVKLTMKPDSELVHYRRGPCDEGWSGNGSTWRFDGHTLREYWIDEGRDCDGYIRTTGERYCDVGELKARVEEADSQFPDNPPRPVWHAGDERVHDEYAVAAGY
jgi:hypothetical protein